MFLRKQTCGHRKAGMQLAPERRKACFRALRGGAAAAIWFRALARNIVCGAAGPATAGLFRGANKGNLKRLWVLHLLVGEDFR